MNSKIVVGVLLVGLTACQCSGKEDTASTNRNDGTSTAPPAPQIDLSAVKLPGEGQPLLVVAARPQGKQQGEVRPTVTFDRPVQTLEMVEATRAKDAAAPPAQIVPALEGQWRWLGSSTMEFVPKGLVPYSSEFTVTVRRGLKALDGATLAEDYVFKFSTPVLELQDTFPVSGFKWLTPEATVNLLFNQKVKVDDLKNGLTIQGPKGSVSYEVAKEISIEEERRLEREEAQKKGQPWAPLSDEERGFQNHQHRYTIKPKSPLPLGAKLQFSFSEKLHGADGPLLMQMPKDSVFFETYGSMEVSSADFGNSYGPLKIYTSNLAEIESLKSRLQITPAVELDWDRANAWKPTNKWDFENAPFVTVSGKFKPGTSYKVQIATGVEDEFKQALGKEFSGTARTEDLDPSMYMSRGFGVLEAGSVEPKLPVELANLTTLNVEMWKLDATELVQQLALERSSQMKMSRAADFQEAEKLNIPKNNSRVHPLLLQKVLGEGVKTGLALVQIDSPQLKSKNSTSTQLVQVTDLAAHLKIGPKSSLVWVTRLSTGAPEANCKLSLYGEDANVVWTGTTNAEGFADIPGAATLPVKSVKDSWEYPFLVVVAQKEGDISATANTWASGVEPYEFGLAQGWEGERADATGFAFTDRGIYRPGDEVFVKGVVRYRVVGALKIPPAGTKLTLEVTDSRGEKVFSQNVVTNAYGTVSGKGTIPKDSPTGYFSVAIAGPTPQGNIRLGESFRVEEYRAPQFRVDVNSKTKNLIAGEAFNATVSARYLFGGAMNDVRVKWSAQRTSTTFASESVPDFTFAQETWWWDDNQPRDASGFVASNELQTSKTGDAEVKVGVTESPGEKPYTYTLEAEVTDVNRQAVAGRTEVTVHPAQYYVGLKSTTYFMEKDKAYPIEVAVVSALDGKRVNGKNVKINIISRTWKSVKKKDATGGFSTISEPEEKEVHSCEVKSATSAACNFTPSAAGFFIVKAQVKDDSGRTHSSSLGVYATGADWVAWQRNDTDKIELLTDKTKYDVGDVAKVLIKSPYPESRAMLTVEREGVMSRKLIKLKGSVVTVEIPITEDMVPNVFAGVLIMRQRVAQGGIETGDDPGRPTARIGLVKINVEKKTKRLNVTVTTDKKDFRPREKVQVQLSVKDFNGKPVSGEATLYAVDEAVLRITSYETPDPIAAIFQDRPLSVRLGEPLLHLVRRRNYGEKGEEQGGGGGSSEGAGIRNKFKTTVAFLPNVEVKDGKASATFELPDNLTSFRVMAVVVTNAERFGSGQASFQVNKPLMALPALPRFAREGDSFEAGAVIHRKEGTGEVTVTAQVTGPAKLVGPPEKKILVSSSAPQEVRFPFTATGSGTAKFVFKVSDGAKNDGVEEQIPVEFPVELDAVATYGDTTTTRVEGIAPPKDVHADRGGLTVSMSSTALAGFDRGFQQLIDYPYGCLEQQSSRLVPFVALREISNQFGVAWPGRDAKKAASDDAVNRWLNAYLFPTLDVSMHTNPDDVVNATVKSIVALQDGDGSFRYWPDSQCADSWTSTYATLSLYRAHEAGFAVPTGALAKAQAFLGRVVGGSCHSCEYTCDDEKRTFAAYVLARMKKPRASAYSELYSRRESLSQFSKALLANAMFVGGGNKGDANKLMQEILNNAKESPKGIQISETNSKTYANYFQSDTRTTGVVLQALSDINPNHPHVAKLAKYLTGVREGDGQWRTTQEAAWSLMGLTQVLKTKEKENPDFKASLMMGTAVLVEAAFHGRSMEVQTKTVSMEEVLSKSAGAEQKLSFKKEGTGVLYYSALLRYAPKEMPMKPLDSGLFVQRWFEPYGGTGQSLKFVAGDLVRVRLRVATNQERHWAAFEVPLPAGLEPVDTSLATTARLDREPNQESSGVTSGEETGEDGAEGDAEEGHSNPWAYSFFTPFNHVEMRDSRVVFFADHLPPGVHVTSFVARATTPGKFLAKPARGELMYEPEVWGRSEGGVLEVVLPTSVSAK
jgi:alpha-2-macroglobulin